MAAIYDGLNFETELLAKWAAFFDLAGWDWKRDPVPVQNWKPDFRVTFDCGHSECSGSHTILISVLPVHVLEELKGHPALAYMYSIEDSRGKYLADAGAIFGESPATTYWEMSHGSGGGAEDVTNWVNNADSLWNQASAKVSSSN